MTITVRRYDDTLSELWNDFVGSSKNGTFLFNRGFMDYHRDRFSDHSLLFYNNNELIALLPACEKSLSTPDAHILSHGGLTYGGVLCNTRMSAELMLEIFFAMISYYQSHEFKRILYKVIPHIYHKYPSEEDLYALFRFNAVLQQVDNSTTIYQPARLPFAKGKKYGVSKAAKNNLSILHKNNPSEIAAFFTLLNETLQERHDTKATHTVEEMTLLTARFPENIKCHTIYQGDILLAGVLIFLTDTLAHTQYMATSPLGRDIAALDLLLHVLINEIYVDKTYFNFGISNEAQGTILNHGLCRQKEMLGGRSTAQLIFLLPLE
jgi:hypothetical protein